MSDREALVDRIYEAAVVPELWPGVLHDIAELAGCFGGIIFTTTARGITRWTGSDEGKRFFDAFLANRAAQEDNVRLKRGIEAKRHGFFGTHELYGRTERESSAVYTEFLLPNGWGYAAGSVLPMPNGDLAVFDLERRFADGPVSAEELAQLNALWPHMARSAALSIRLQLQRARAIVDTLDKAGMPAAILSGQDRILAANSAFEAMKEQVVFLAHGKLALADVASNRLLAQALHAIRASVTTMNSIPVPAQADSSAAVIHALPLPGEASDVFYGATAIVIVTKLDRSTSPSAEILTGLFDLTPAEATVANRILAGLSVNEVAIERRISRETVRSQVKKILAKTGSQSQADFIRRLAPLAI